MRVLLDQVLVTTGIAMVHSFQYECIVPLDPVLTVTGSYSFQYCKAKCMYCAIGSSFRYCKAKCMYIRYVCYWIQYSTLALVHGTARPSALCVLLDPVLA